MQRFKDLKQYFIDSSPVSYDKKGLSTLIDELWSYHINQKEKDQFISKLNKYKRNNTEEEWYSLFAEMHSLYLINRKHLGNGRAVFSPEEDNDLFLSTHDVSKKIEVKSILPGKFEKEYYKIWHKIINISSDMVVQLEIKNFKDTGSVLEEIEKIGEIGINGYNGENIAIKVIRGVGDKGGVIGRPITFWISIEDLSNLIIRKVENKSSQINNADVVILYVYGLSNDVDDICDALNMASSEIYVLRNKEIICIIFY